jgi:sulfofructose kinase
VSHFDVLGIGRPYADLLLVVPRMPEADSVTRVQQVGHQGGGVVPTAMVAAARLGVQAAIWAHISDDYYGEFIIDDFEKYGVNVEHLQVIPGYHSPLSTVLVDQSTSTRSIMPYWGTLPVPTADDFDDGLVPHCRVLHLSGSYVEVELKAARIAKAAGVTVSFDGGAGLLSPERRGVAELADVLVVARQFAEALTGFSSLRDCALSLLDLGAHTVVITEGAAGSYGWTSDGETHYQQSFDVEVVDTTGAGDVYHGAFLAELLQGWTLPQNMVFASATAALKCTHVGGRAGIPTRREVEGFLSRQ